MATVSVVLDSRPKKDKTFAIKIRVTDGSKSRYKGFDFSVRKDQFKEGMAGWVVKHPDALFINAQIEDARSLILEKITRLKLDRKPFSFDYVLSDTPAGGHTVGEILDIIANRHLGSQDLTRGYRHISIKNQILDCFGKDLLLNEITIEEVRKLDAYFIDVVGNSRNTASDKIRRLRYAFNEAKGIWKGEIGDNPFDLIRCKNEPVERQKLNRKQIEAIEGLKLVGVMDVARDSFLFSYYAQGMRFGSVITMMREYISETKINYQMLKGKHFREIKIHPKLQRIIDKYINNDTPYLFPILKKIPKDKRELHFAKDEANVIINTCLKRIAVLAGEGISEELSFHWAKHSYAQMLKISKVDPWIIKDSLGHTTFSTTEAYLQSLDDDHINEAVTGLY
jgi:integrase